MKETKASPEDVKTRIAFVRECLRTALTALDSASTQTFPLHVDDPLDVVGHSIANAKSASMGALMQLDILDPQATTVVETKTIEVPGDEVAIGDQLVAWKLAGYSGGLAWKSIGTPVTVISIGNAPRLASHAASAGRREATCTNNDTYTLTGYAFRVIRKKT